MRLALFDLDNTLLGGDSDHAWGDYLCRRGILDGDAYKARNDAFYQDYLAGIIRQNDPDIGAKTIGVDHGNNLANACRRIVPQSL